MILDVRDVAETVLENLGPMHYFRMHRIVYWCQGYYLAWEYEPMFDSEILAYRDGPQIPDLHEHHEISIERVNTVLGHTDVIPITQREVIDKICNFYGDYKAFELSQIVRAEEPWIRARHGLTVDTKVGNVIEEDRMANYYYRISKDKNV